MVDMWMLSVAAALVDDVDQPGPLALLEQIVRAQPNLAEALDALRAAAPAAQIPLAETLADSLKAAYDERGTFAGQLDALWPQVLFGPKPATVGNVLNGNMTGKIVQARVITGGIHF